MKKSFLQRSQYVIIGLGLLPVLLAVAAYQTISRSLDSVRATLVTNQLIRSLNELLASVQEAETGQRGFVLTGRDVYLKPFVEAEQRVPVRIQELKAAAAGNQVPAAQVQPLLKALQRRMTELRETIRLRREEGLLSALRMTETDEGERNMATIRDEVTRLRTQQEAIFQNRLAEQREAEQNLRSVLVGGICLPFAFVLVIYRLNYLYVRKRDFAEQEFRRLNATLEQRVRERTTDLQAKAEELEAKTTELQRSNADLMQFAYVASHDLQEPLRMVSSYVELLAHRYSGNLDDKADTYIRYAVDGAKRMQALIEDLLNYSQAGTQAISKKTVPARDVFDRAIGNLKMAMQEKKAEIRMGAMPDIYADEVKLALVVQNLLANAIKFSRPGVAPIIDIRAVREAAEWVFSVADNGLGFDPKFTDRIFQIFQRLHGFGAFPGNGIGLAISRRIIEHHGGRLWAQSEQGAGSTFFFSLPIATDTARSESQIAEGEKRRSSAPLTHV